MSVNTPLIERQMFFDAAIGSSVRDRPRAEYMVTPMTLMARTVYCGRRPWIQRHRSSPPALCFLPILVICN
jgi:hypothetical protein